MAWSFRKRIKIIPGVHLNLSKSGLSTSIGHISSADIHKITSQGMQGVKEAIILARQQRKELEQDLLSIQTALVTARLKLMLSYIFLYGLIIKSISDNLKADIATQIEAIKQTNEEIEDCYVNLNIDIEPGIKEKYDQLANSFNKLMNSHRIWDVTSAHFQDRVIARSSASTIVDKQDVKFSFRSIPELRSDFKALYFQNANGADLYCYPCFIVLYSSGSAVEIIGIDEINIQQSVVRFTETGAVPPDSKIIDTTWAKVNKNGTPDKRFNDNYQIPIVQYGELRLSSKNGLDEEYEFSNYESTEEFSSIFKEYQMIIRRSNMAEMSTASI